MLLNDIMSSLKQVYDRYSNAGGKMVMTKSYSKDIQLLMRILKNQQNIKDVMTQFNCNTVNK